MRTKRSCWQAFFNVSIAKSTSKRCENWQQWKIILPGVRGGAEGNLVISGGTSEGTSLIIVSIAVSAWTSVLKSLRIRRRPAGIRCTVCSIATILWRPKSFTSAFTGHAFPFRTSNLKFWRARVVQIHNASCACTILTRTSLRDNKQWQVVPINKTHIKIIHPSIAVKLELC